MAKNRWIIVLLLVSAITGCSPFSPKAIRFEDVRHGQRVKNTPYTVNLTVERTELTEGRSLEVKSLSLTHEPTGKTQIVSEGMYFEDTPKGKVCRNCLTTITHEDTHYIISSRHGGGSGGFYGHDVFELTDEKAMERGYFVSCGQVFRAENEIMFPSAELKCPELFFSTEGGADIVETFSLAQ